MNRRALKIHNIHRYLSDEAPSEEKQEFENWLEKSESNRQMFRRYREIYEVDPGYNYQFDAEAALKTFRKVMDGGQQSRTYTSAEPEKSRKKAGVHIWMKAAAVLIAICSLSLYMIISFDFTGEGSSEEIAAGVTIETSPGEQKSFRLSDGSRIQLNAGSEVYVPSGFGTENRDVRLRGEAFFDVASGHTHEFAVETNAARVSVLGTSFAVRAWTERDESVITVQSGQVSVHSSDPEINDHTILQAGQYSQVFKGQAPGPAIQSNTEQYLGWTNQMFVFDETPLRDVLRQLELHFNVKIEISDSTSIDDPVTARYRSESLEEILKYTSITHGIEFEVESTTNRNQQ